MAWESKPFVELLLKSASKNSPHEGNHEKAKSNDNTNNQRDTPTATFINTSQHCAAALGATATAVANAGALAGFSRPASAFRIADLHLVAGGERKAESEQDGDKRGELRQTPGFNKRFSRDRQERRPISSSSPGKRRLQSYEFWIAWPMQKAAAPDAGFGGLLFSAAALLALNPMIRTAIIGRMQSCFDARCLKKWTRTYYRLLLD
jgi:hypothetical protein